MDPKLRRKLIVSGTGVVILIGALVAAYIFYLGPRLKIWREARKEITTREKRLEELRKEFGNQKNPQDEIRVLDQEIQGLIEANKKLEKIKTPGTEMDSLPEELKDKDPAIQLELYKDYLKQVMAADSNKIKEKLKSAAISPPELKLYQDLKDAHEVPFYLNRAGGLQGMINALAQSRSPEGKLLIDEVILEDYAAATKRREGAVNIMSYLLKMTLDTQTLVSFLYNLREQDAFYYVDHLDISPRPTTRGGTQELNVEARVNTTMVFKSQVQAQVQAALAEASKTTSGDSGVGAGWMAQLAAGMKRQMEAEKAKPKKKWYEFWKWFKD